LVAWIGRLSRGRALSYRDLSGRRLAIDAANLLHRLLAGSGGRLLALRSLLMLHSSLAYTGSYPVYVFEHGLGSLAATARELLTLLGAPTVEAPGEGDAQAAYLVKAGLCWAAVSMDYDLLLYACPRLLRPRGRGFELHELDRLLESSGVSYSQLLDAAYLAGTSVSPGVGGIGWRRALEIARRGGASSFRAAIPLEEFRRLYTNPPVVHSIPSPAGVDEEGFRRRAAEAGLSGEAIDRILSKVRRAGRGFQTSLD